MGSENDRSPAGTGHQAVRRWRCARTDLKTLDDAALVAEYLGGRRRAFHELADRYHLRLLNFIYRTIGDRDRAEDLVQETFVQSLQASSPIRSRRRNFRPGSIRSPVTSRRTS